MKKKYHTVGTIPKSNQNNRRNRVKIYAPHDCMVVGYITNYAISTYHH